MDNIEWRQNLSTGNFGQQLVSVYPNPAADIVNIATDRDIRQVNVYNQLSQLVGTQTTSSVDLSAFSAGLYILEIRLSDHTTSTHKVVKK